MDPDKKLAEAITAKIREAFADVLPHELAGEKVVKDPPVDHGFTCSCTYCKTYAPRLQSHDPRAYRHRGVQPDRTCHWSDKYWADYPRSRDRVGLTNGEWGLRIGELQRVADRILDDLIESLQSLREERA